MHKIERHQKLMCLSADFEAQSALRVQISAFQTGEAASMDIVKNLT